VCRIETPYRIRKLTPRECGRLMAVTDNDITKMLEVNSNTQCYKEFGNSIVVTVLEAIFRNLNVQGIKRWEEIDHE
jgi:DNA (cytosine-5)-methyltransferase 1